MSVRQRHQRERSARREAILAAAARVFARHGLDGATIETVAREAEVAVGTIYLYFTSRDDLFLSLVGERARRLSRRYQEIQSRGLEPLDELRTMTAAYVDYIRESRELFLAQQSVVWSKLDERLRRPSERRNYRRVMAQAHEIFQMWERSVTRVFPPAANADGKGGAKTAAVLWATVNGAFTLMSNDGFFRDVTGLDAGHFVEEALEHHLAAAGLAPKRTARPRPHAVNGSNGARKRSEEKLSNRLIDEHAASAPADS